eukprot:scpid90623/ scgid19920/ DnaJ protein homolog 1
MACRGMALRRSILLALLVLVISNVFDSHTAVDGKKSPPKDFYKVLGVKKDASSSEIRRAYRKLALKYHPDKNKEKGADQRWLAIAEAYEVLGDKDKRQRYDKYGEAGLNDNNGFGGGGPGGGFNGEGFSFHFDDIFGGGGSPFDDFFAGGGGGGPNMFFEQPFGHGHAHHEQDEHMHFQFDSDFMHGPGAGAGAGGGGHDHMFFADDGMQDYHAFHGGGAGGGGGGMFDDFGFEDMFAGDDMFHHGGGGHGHQYFEASNQQQGGERCRVVTQKIGNMVTTQTICS